MYKLVNIILKRLMKLLRFLLLLIIKNLRKKSNTFKNILSFNVNIVLFSLIKLIKYTVLFVFIIYLIFSWNVYYYNFNEYDI